MSRPNIPYRVEPMTLEDLDAVMAIEQQAHTAPWPVSAYRHELERNDLAHYIVLIAEENHPLTNNDLRGRFLAWFDRSRAGRLIVGYGGFWLMAGEAHISTIAIATAFRGLGLGELVLLELIEHGLRLQAQLVTLEVRVSNIPAQNLYEKFGFRYAGKRKRYYRDNNEDAHIMTVEEIQRETYRRFLDERWIHLQRRFCQQEKSVPSESDR